MSVSEVPSYDLVLETWIHSLCPTDLTVNDTLLLYVSHNNLNEAKEWLSAPVHIQMLKTAMFWACWNIEVWKIHIYSDLTLTLDVQLLSKMLREH